jgi:hypothetical protein
MRFARDMLTSERDMQHSLREINNHIYIYLVSFLFATFSFQQRKSSERKKGAIDGKKSSKK